MQNSSKGNNSWKNHGTRTRRWYAHPPSILNIPMKFQWNPTSSFREFAWTRTVPYIFMQNSSKGNNSWKNHRTRTRRWYAHPPLILNIPMKFHWNPTSSFREFAWTRAGRTHGRTDTRTYGCTDTRTHGRSGDYMLPRNSSGSITSLALVFNVNLHNTVTIVCRLYLLNRDILTMLHRGTACSASPFLHTDKCRFLLECHKLPFINWNPCFSAPCLKIYDKVLDKNTVSSSSYKIISKIQHKRQLLYLFFHFTTSCCI